jgi:Zn-dependent metalloprotease/PKD repeat protein
MKDYKEDLQMKRKRRKFERKIFFTLTLVIMVCCFMVTSSWAARKVDLTSANAGNFIGQLNRNGAAMGPVFGLSQGEQFKLLRQTKDFRGVTHSRYEQTYKGIPVWGMQTVVSRDRNSTVSKLHGALALGIPDDVVEIPNASMLKPQAALRERQELHKGKDSSAVWDFRNEKYGTYIYLDKKDRAHLCYVVSFFADTDRGNPSQPIFFIDVKSGKVLDSYDMLRYQGVGPGGNLKIGYYYYGTDYPSFCVSEASGTCSMYCPDVKTVDLNHGTSGATAYSYPCYENTHEQINGAYCPMNDAQYFGQVVFDTYMEWYGVPVLPFQLTLRCHYSTNYENAFWDGSTMTFGDGYTKFYPLVSLDVVAHEVSHGFTEYHSNLIYSGQSGGINEAFSDIAGESCEYFMRGTTDFMCGYDIFKAPTGALRYLYDPPLDGKSIDHVDDYYDGMDVHYSSGIFNKVFYLIATSPGWNAHKAFDIFVKANQDYWVPSSTFVLGAEGVMDAAVDYGYSCQDVVNAFAVVGIDLVCPGPPVADFSASLVSGGVPLTTTFIDQSQAASSWSWDFGDGGTSTLKDPAHTYTAIGVYTVTLTVSNGYGSDTEVKTDYITVTTPQPPIADFIASATQIYIGETVTFTDLTLENPSSWSWSFEGGTPSSSTAQHPTVTYNSVGTFNVTLVATNAQGSNATTKVDYITVSEKPYCALSGSYQSLEYIAGVTVADLNNVSGASPYSDFTSLSTHITQGATVNVSLTPGFPQGSYFEYWKIWIDYNADHDFEDVGEEVFSGSGSSIVSGNFVVPLSTIVGNTRMRVAMRWGNWPPICGTFSYGEVEDYTAVIAKGGPTLTVISPNGGENWPLGSIHPITWNAVGLSANLKITLWKDGVLVGTIADNVAPALGSYSWTVGQYSGGTAATGTGYTIKIKETGTVVSDMSDAAFTISPMSGITVTSPNGGENWPWLSIHNITWNAVGLSANLKITLWKNGVLVGTIGDSVAPSPGSYSWAAGQYSGGTATVGTGYSIKIKEIGTVISDMSDASFIISGLTITSPNGGESWQLGSIHNITWNAAGLSANLKITLWKDGVLVGTIADNIAPSQASYAWPAGQYSGGTTAAGTGYTIKIKEIGTVVADLSDASFSLTN